MAQRFRDLDDFEAGIRILSAQEDGRTTPARNGIRWDLCYAEDNPADGIWMIWPDFLDEAGESRSEDEDLPVATPLRAKMRILSNELRREIHQSKAKVGTRFFCHEGPKRVAEGVITKITGLFCDRAKHPA